MDPKDIWLVIFSDPQNNFAKNLRNQKYQKLAEKNQDCQLPVTKMAGM
ncbi:hypothetical protein [Methanosarcina lacustris]|nr:hypothetical protein [Methanosarcina lacustris]